MSQTRQDVKPYASYNGVNIYQLTLGRQIVEATVSYGETRIMYRGQIGIDRTEGSYRFGDQVLIAMWMRDLPKIETRCRQKGYSRIQINMTIPEAITMFKEALQKLEALEREKIWPTKRE